MNELPPDERQPTVSLSMRQRISCVALGMAGLGGGTTATFITRNSVGSGVLLAIGALFSLVGVTGNAPTRARFGDSEMEFSRARALENVVTTALQSSDPEVKSQVAEEVLELTLPNTDRVRELAEGVRYETAVFKTITDLGISVTVAHRFIPLDGVLSWNGKRIGLISRYDGRPSSLRHTFDEAQAAIEQLKTQPTSVVGVLVVRSRMPTNWIPSPTVGRVVLADSPLPDAGTYRVRLLLWDPEDGSERMAAAIDGMQDLADPTTLNDEAR